MMPRAYLVAAALAFSSFTYLQAQGWSIFDSFNSPSSQYSSSGSRTYHK